MFKDEELESQFTYVPPTSQDVEVMKRYRQTALALARLIVATQPASPDRSSAIRYLRQSIMYANAGRVLNRPAPPEPQVMQEDPRWIE